MLPTIFWAGDSTVKNNDLSTYPQTGIAKGLEPFLAKGINISNHAENGRSTKSFIAELRLKAIDSQIKEGDFLFIQFGHNDSKAEDPLRFTQPFDEYQKNLIAMIKTATRKMAYPVLITPLSRCWFVDENTLEENIHGDYPKAMINVALDLNVPVLDLYSTSRRLLKNLGHTKSKNLFMNLRPGEYRHYLKGIEDNTHLKYEGALVFGKLLADELKNLGGIYRTLLSDDFLANGTDINKYNIT